MKKENHSLTNFSLLFFLVLLVSASFTESCTKVNEFTIGDNFVASQTHLIVADTFRVDVSTVLLDSIVTSNRRVAFAGSYSDEECGRISCKSYFRIAYENFEQPATSAVFDSAAFVFVNSGFYAGDTTRLLTLGIHRVTEEMKHFYNDSYFYNNTSFDYSPDLLGSLSFYPTPKSSDTTVSVPVNSLGEEIFNLIRDNDEIVSSSDWFNDYFKGFVLTSEDPDNNMILGFTADETHISLKLYYHLNLEAPVEKEITIKMGSESDQFNHIDYNSGTSALEKIKDGGDLVSGSEAGNIAVLQGLAGLTPMIRFPSVQDFLLENKHKVIKAELIFEPVKKSYEIFTLPGKLYLYESDRWRNFSFNKLLKNADSEAIISTLETDYMYDDIKYTLDITDYIIEELSDGYFDYNHGLYIALSQDGMTSSPARLIIETKDPSMKLRLYYITY